MYSVLLPSANFVLAAASLAGILDVLCTHKHLGLGYLPPQSHGLIWHQNLIPEEFRIDSFQNSVLRPTTIWANAGTEKVHRQHNPPGGLTGEKVDIWS